MGRPTSNSDRLPHNFVVKLIQTLRESLSACAAEFSSLHPYRLPHTSHIDLTSSNTWNLQNLLLGMQTQPQDPHSRIMLDRWVRSTVLNSANIRASHSNSVPHPDSPPLANHPQPFESNSATPHLVGLSPESPPRQSSILLPETSSSSQISPAARLALSYEPEQASRLLIMPSSVSRSTSPTISPLPPSSIFHTLPSRDLPSTPFDNTLPHEELGRPESLSDSTANSANSLHSLWVRRGLPTWTFQHHSPLPSSSSTSLPGLPTVQGEFDRFVQRMYNQPRTLPSHRSHFHTTGSSLQVSSEPSSAPAPVRTQRIQVTLPGMSSFLSEPRQRANTEPISLALRSNAPLSVADSGTHEELELRVDRGDIGLLDDEAPYQRAHQDVAYSDSELLDIAAENTYSSRSEAQFSMGLQDCPHLSIDMRSDPSQSLDGQPSDHLLDVGNRDGDVASEADGSQAGPSGADPSRTEAFADHAARTRAIARRARRSGSESSQPEHSEADSTHSRSCKRSRAPCLSSQPTTAEIAEREARASNVHRALPAFYTSDPFYVLETLIPVDTDPMERRKIIRQHQTIRWHNQAQRALYEASTDGLVGEEIGEIGFSYVRMPERILSSDQSAWKPTWMSRGWAGGRPPASSFRDYGLGSFERRAHPSLRIPAQSDNGGSSGDLEVTGSSYPQVRLPRHHGITMDRSLSVLPPRLPVTTRSAASARREWERPPYLPQPSPPL